METILETLAAETFESGQPYPYLAFGSTKFAVASDQPLRR
jgi:hypothetical protein